MSFKYNDCFSLMRNIKNCRKPSSCSLFFTNGDKRRLMTQMTIMFRLLKKINFSILAGGFSWIADAYFCDQLTAFKTYDNIFARILGPFIQGHALWHVFSAAASYCQVSPVGD